MRRWVILFGTLLAGFCVCVFLAGSLLLAPAPASIPDTALPVPHESVEFRGPSGNVLHGWFAPAASDARGTIVLKVPVLIIAGGADRHTTPADSARLFAAAAEHKQLWMIPGAAHVDFEAYAGQAYAERVVSFFAAAASRSPGSRLDTHASL